VRVPAPACLLALHEPGDAAIFVNDDAHLAHGEGEAARAPSFAGSSERDRCVLAMHTGSSAPPSSRRASRSFLAPGVKSTSSAPYMARVMARIFSSGGWLRNSRSYAPSTWRARL
jgi:hypothetical protein